MSGVDLAHAVRVWRGVGRQGGADFMHEGKGGFWRGPQSEHPGLLVGRIAEAVPVPAGATNIEPGAAS